MASPECAHGDPGPTSPECSEAGSLATLLTCDEDTPHILSLNESIRYAAGISSQPLLRMTSTGAAEAVEDNGSGFCQEIFCVGGHNGGDTSYQNQLGTSRSISAHRAGNQIDVECGLPEAEHCGCVAGMVGALDDPDGTTQQVFVIGGFNGTVRLDTIQEYDISNRTWSQRAKMDGPLWGGGVATHNQTQTVWALGGYTGSDIIDRTYVYDRLQDCWFTGPPQLAKSNSGGVAFIEDTIFRGGGQLQDYKYTESVECLRWGGMYEDQNWHEEQFWEDWRNAADEDADHVNANKWQAVAHLSCPRYRPGSCVMNNKWYMVGGANNGGSMSSGEVYDPGADTWTQLPTMKVRRAGHGLVGCEGRIVAIGGFHGQALQSVETYDPREGKWMLVGGDIGADGLGIKCLPTKLDGPGVCSIVSWKPHREYWIEW